MDAIGHLDLVVSDFEASLAFYRSLLRPLGYVRESVIAGERGERVTYLNRVAGGGSTEQWPRRAVHLLHGRHLDLEEWGQADDRCHADLRGGSVVGRAGLCVCAEDRHRAKSVVRQPRVGCAHCRRGGAQGVGGSRRESGERCCSSPLIRTPTAGRSRSASGRALPWPRRSWRSTSRPPVDISKGPEAWRTSRFPIEFVCAPPL